MFNYGGTLLDLFGKLPIRNINRSTSILHFIPS